MTRLRQKPPSAEGIHSARPLPIIDLTDAWQTPTKTYAHLTAQTAALNERYRQITSRSEVSWEVSYRLVRKLGSGGQGIVYLADRFGAFDVRFRLALKFFRPDGYPDIESYRDDMARLARVAMMLGRIQHDNLLDVYNVVELQGVQLLAMEWVDGFDLRRLLTPKTLDQVRASVDNDRWDYVNDVIVTRAGTQLRLKPGVAISVLRECLSGVAAMHRGGLLHADLKPANIMVKRTGNCKIIDFGSAFSTDDLPSRPLWTPRYAAVEVLEGDNHSIASDLASLGYILYEMLSGVFPFCDATDGEDLVRAKLTLAEQLPDLLPPDVARNGTLVNLLARLIAPDPADRYRDAEEADLSEHGAAEFQRELIKGDLASEYENEIRLLLTELD